MDRVILLSDANSFYASVSCLYDPSLKNKPVAVGGDEEARHGIVLSANQTARKFGIKTAETLLEARRKCKDLITVRADFDLYLKYARKLQAIYEDYTPLAEHYSIDESYLDVTGSQRLFGSGKEIADEIRRRVRDELGLSVSVGVSWNMIFAKLASDMVKPDATTLITKENYKRVAWPLPANKLLFVGNETYKKLIPMNILTIGDLANADEERLKLRFGKVGLMLKVYANGYDLTSVNPKAQPVKGVGHSNTLPRDIIEDEDVRAAIYKLSEGVAVRLRGHGLKCRGVQIYIRDKDMFSIQRQGMLEFPTNITNEIAAKAFEVYREKGRPAKPIRTIGVKAIELVNQDQLIQMDLFGDQLYRTRLERAESAMDGIRARFGKYAIMKAGNMASAGLTGGLGRGSETNTLIELFGGAN